jgi:hypothetical protein
MNLYKSPTEAINACNDACEKEWEICAAAIKLNESKDPTTYNATKSVFRAGYMAGAKWVSGAIVENMMIKAARQPKQPNTSSKV